MGKWYRKPKVLFLVDTNNWAWSHKARELTKHLSDEFEFKTIPMLVSRDGFNVRTHDLYFTFGASFVPLLNPIEEARRISGVTAHKEPGFFKTHILPEMKRVVWRHANSMLLYNELIAAGLDNVFYVPNGVNEEQFRIKTPIPAERRNLVVGHVGKRSSQPKSESKGQKTFIEPACAKAHVEYRGHYNTWKNAVPHEKMPDVYQEFDCFIVASITDGTPCGALEAAACGRPIVSNAIGNMPEFISSKPGHENGFLVDRNIDAYVDKLNYLRDNRDKLIEMGNNARKTVLAEWTWKKQAENYRAMFHTILDQVGLKGSADDK